MYRTSKQTDIPCMLLAIFVEGNKAASGANKRRLSGVMMRFTLMRHDNSAPGCDPMGEARRNRI